MILISQATGAWYACSRSVLGWRSGELSGIDGNVSLTHPVNYCNAELAGQHQKSRSGVGIKRHLDTLDAGLLAAAADMEHLGNREREIDS